MYIVVEDINGTDVFETLPGDCVSFFSTEDKEEQSVMEVGIKRVSGAYERVYRMANQTDAQRTLHCYLEALEKGAKIFYLSETYWGMHDEKEDK